MGIKNIISGAAFFLALVFGLSSHSKESFSLSYGFDQSTCVSGGEIIGTHRIAMDWRRSYENDNLHAYASQAPAGLNCLDDVVTVDLEMERRWPINRAWYGALTIGTDYVGVIGITSTNGDGALRQYVSDSAPSHTFALSSGRHFGPLSLEGGINLVPNDYVGSTQHALRLAATYVAEDFAYIGGDLLIEASTIGPRISLSRRSILVRWARSFEGTNMSFVASWRYEGGLDILASSFTPVKSESIVVDIGLGWEIP